MPEYISSIRFSWIDYFGFGAEASNLIYIYIEDILYVYKVEAIEKLIYHLHLHSDNANDLNVDDSNGVGKVLRMIYLFRVVFVLGTS